MRGKANEAGIQLGVCCRPPDCNEEVAEELYRQLAELSQLLPLILMGHLNLPDVCWKENAAEETV